MQGPHLRKYGAATTVDFTLYKLDGTGLKTDAAHAAGDTKIMKDEGAEGNTTNAFVDEGQTYSIALTATEMQAARVVLIIVDQTSPQVWLDTTIVIDTYGNANAQHIFDLGTASTAQTGDSYARLGAPAGASVSADIAAIESQTDDIGAAGAGLSAIPWNAAWDAEVQSEANDALVANNLDHLLKTATAGADMTAEVADNTVLSRIIGNGDTSTFIQATDGLRPIATDVAATHVHAAGAETQATAAATSLANGGFTDLILDDILLDTGTTLDGKLNTIDGIVDDILIDTAVIGALGAGLTGIPWNAAWDAQVESEVTDSLIAHNLDHLCLTPTAGADMTAEVADNTILSRMLSSGDTSVFDPTTDALQDIRDKLTDIETDTAEIGADGAGLSDIPWNADWDAEVQSEATDALNAYDPPTDAEMIARTLAAASYFDPAADAVANVTTVNGLANDVITAASLKSDAVTEIWQYTLENAKTVEQALRIIFAFAKGKSNGGGTATIKFRDDADGKDRITATVDVAGNRTAVSVDGT